MVTSSASTAVFRILVAVLLAAAVVLDVGLARARATGRVPVKPAADCDSPVPSAPVPSPAATADTTAPPGIFAAFGSCGGGDAQAPAASPRK